MGSAILFLWENKIVHRDIKLENFLISSDGIPVLCDFGMAEFVDDLGFCRNSPDSMGGNQAHLAPEVINQWKKDKKPNYSKQPSWELGILCFELATGEHPFGELYPTGEKFIRGSEVFVPEIATNLLIDMKFSQIFINSVKIMIQNDPVKRISISDACSALIKSLES